MKMMIMLSAGLLVAGSLQAKEFHVSPTGSDSAPGSCEQPLRSIQKAADLAQPGDIITVHEGIYRERINPPRGGLSDDQRITYQAAPGEKVIIKGSELVTGWQKLEHDTWRVEVANERFGDFNPFADEIRGDWFNPRGRKHHTAAIYLNGHWLTEAATRDDVLKPAAASPLWFAEVGEQKSVILAQFPGVDPNRETVEMNARQSVFYADQPGRDFITVRGFTLEQAATPWAPPTAEQIGLIGAHWSKGWIIEKNVIRYSACVGVTLGKYGDEWDNRSQSADAYNETIRRSLQNGWSKDKVGSHIVRNNHISHCEQAGIVGSLGAVFSTITGNEIHDIHVRCLFAGAEQAGIKIHAAIDVLIANNHIHHGYRGIWLDWMAQGTRVSGNLLHDNHEGADLFVEVNHGPFLVDHNLFLSKANLLDWSSGGAYVHNVFAGVLKHRSEKRTTPHHQPHSTEVVGLSAIPGGDHRFLNNVFINGSNLAAYEPFAETMTIEGNVTAAGTLVLTLKDGVWSLEDQGVFVDSKPRAIVTSATLGRPRVTGLGYEQPDGSPYRLDCDYNGAQRTDEASAAGPFAKPASGIKVWPKAAR